MGQSFAKFSEQTKMADEINEFCINYENRCDSVGWLIPRVVIGLKIVSTHIKLRYLRVYTIFFPCVVESNTIFLSGAKNLYNTHAYIMNSYYLYNKQINAWALENMKFISRVRGDIIPNIFFLIL